MTLLLWRHARRRPVVLGALAYALLAPTLILVGPAAQGEPRLRVAGLALAAVPALVWEDRCAPLCAATPVGLPAVRRALLATSGVALAVGWGLAAVLARPAGVRQPALEAVAVALLVLAVVGVVVRGREGEPSAAYPVPVLLMSLLLMTRVPQDWSLLLTPDARVGGRWVVVVAGCALAAGWAGRDPAARPLLSLLRTRSRPDPREEDRADRDVLVTTSRRRRSG